MTELSSTVVMQNFPNGLVILNVVTFQHQFLQNKTNEFLESVKSFILLLYNMYSKIIGTKITIYMINYYTVQHIKILYKT